MRMTISHHQNKTYCNAYYSHLTDSNVSPIATWTTGFFYIRTSESGPDAQFNVNTNCDLVDEGGMVTL